MSAEVDLDGIVFTMTDAIADAIRSGQLDPDVACMQGRIKVSGAVERIYDVIPLARNERFLGALKPV